MRGGGSPTNSTTFPLPIYICTSLGHLRVLHPVFDEATPEYLCKSRGRMNMRREVFVKSAIIDSTRPVAGTARGNEQRRRRLSGYRDGILYISPRTCHFAVISRKFSGRSCRDAIDSQELPPRRRPTYISFPLRGLVRFYLARYNERSSFVLLCVRRAAANNNRSSCRQLPHISDIALKKPLTQAGKKEWTDELAVECMRNHIGNHDRTLSKNNHDISRSFYSDIKSR